MPVSGGENANSNKIDIRNYIDDPRINEIVRYKNIKHFGFN